MLIHVQIPHSLLGHLVEQHQNVEYYVTSYSSAAKSRNLAISKAEGLFTTGLDDDDFFLENHISNLLTFFYSRNSCSYLYFDYFEIRPSRVKHIKKISCMTSAKLYAYNIPGNQIFIYTSFLKQIGGFDESMDGWEDYDLWVRVTKAFGCGERSKLPTYMMDTSHQFERITSSSLHGVGASQFLSNHRQDMPLTTRLLHELEVALFNKKTFRLKYLIAVFSPTPCMQLRHFVNYAFNNCCPASR